MVLTYYPLRSSVTYSDQAWQISTVINYLPDIIKLWEEVHVFKAVNSNERKILKKRTTFICLHTKSYAIKHWYIFLKLCTLFECQCI